MSLSAEADFIARLRRSATDPGARGLLDDVATLIPPPGETLVLTHDMLVEGVHYFPDDPPADVAWKLVAVNLSDLAAKGARPLGVLVGHMLGRRDWDAAFADGLAAAIGHFAVPLLGGDTVAGSDVRVLGLTAIGAATRVPDRRGARAGDELWVTGTIGDAGLGLRLAAGALATPDQPEAVGPLLSAYRRPLPRLDIGARVAALAHATADVSDGLLIDAARIASASGLAVEIDLALVPLSATARAIGGEDRAARLAAATAGDDYQILAAAPRSATDRLVALGLTRIGRFAVGNGLTLVDGEAALALLERLGWAHGERPAGT